MNLDEYMHANSDLSICDAAVLKHQKEIESANFFLDILKKIKTAINNVGKRTRSKAQKQRDWSFLDRMCPGSDHAHAAFLEGYEAAVRDAKAKRTEYKRALKTAKKRQETQKEVFDKLTVLYGFAVQEEIND